MQGGLQTEHWLAFIANLPYITQAPYLMTPLHGYSTSHPGSHQRKLQPAHQGICIEPAAIGKHDYPTATELLYRKSEYPVSGPSKAVGMNLLNKRRSC